MGLEYVDEPADQVPQAADGSLAHFAEHSLEPGEGLLDRVEVRAVVREIKEARACGFGIRLRSQAPNFVESDAQAVPASPQTAALRIARVAFATLAHASLSAAA